MVKPPKTMQPESVDLAKAGRAAGKAFEEDSFRNYMARKIDMQRKQFGLELPPDPRLIQANNNQKDNNDVAESTVDTTGNGSDHKQETKTPARRQEQECNSAGKLNGESVSGNNNNKKRKLHHVTFAASVKDNEASSSDKNKKQKKSKKKQRGPMNHLLKKLKRRHGKGLRPPSHKVTSSSKHSAPADQPQRPKEMEENGGQPKEEMETESIPNHNQLVTTSILKRTVDDTKKDCQLVEHVENAPSQKESSPRRDEDSSQAWLPVKESEESTKSAAETIQLDEDDESDGEESIGDKKQPATSLHLRRSPQMIRERPDLFFYGVVVMVNGYTDPDTETIQRLMHKHGGSLEKYETTRITHIIATQLSKAKADIYKKMKRPIPVVKPSWIVDSVKAFRLLPHGDYLLNCVKGNMTSMRAFLKSAAQKTDADTKEPENPEDSHAVDEEGDSSEGAATNPMGTMQETDNDNLEHRNDKPPSIAEEAPTAINSPPAKPTTIGGRTDDKFINGKIRTVGTDPNFLDTFFSNSRLSFIGSYKQRVQESPKKQSRNSGTSNGDDPIPIQRFVFHADMDCFFAAVVLRNYPEYKDKPVAISHFGKTRNEDHPGGYQQQPKKDSSSECATCNYKAREFGIKKGMFLGRAKELCPNLIVLAYDFDGYEEVSADVAEILERYALEYNGEVEQVSCDEAYIKLDLPGSEPHRMAGDIANLIREEILDKTRCTATIGVGRNKFLAKLATDRVKPNGCFVVRDHIEMLRNLKLKDLHGIGYRTEQKLVQERLFSVQDVWDLGGAADETLKRVLGPGLGKKISAFCKGEDDRLVGAVERKTIGAECNYGVRFDGPYGVHHMVAGLAKEVQKRMEGVGVRGSRVTLKVKQRKQGAKQPPKFLGHGSCHNLSKSLEISGGPTRDWKVICNTGMALLALMKVETDDIRGMGLIMSKLDSNESKSGKITETRGSIKNWFGARKNTSEFSKTSTMIEASDAHEKDESDGNGSPSSQILTTPPSAHDPFDLERYVSNQKTTFRTAINEIKNGKKKTHWIWFVLPTSPYIVNGVEQGSRTNRYFCLRSDDEVVAYLQFESKGVNLQKNYIVIVMEIKNQLKKGITSEKLLSPRDVPKAISSLCLFQRVAQENSFPEVFHVCSDALKLVEKRQQNKMSPASADNNPARLEEIDEGEDEMSAVEGNAAAASDTTFADVALPPMSQIHLSQVEELPSPLREQIKSKMESRKNEEVRQSTKSKSSFSKGRGRQRQADVSIKRMFNLQAMRNNSDASELQNLPLEVQLQIANNDELRLGYRSNKSNSGPSRSKTARLPPPSSAARPQKKSSSVTVILSETDENTPDETPQKGVDVDTCEHERGDASVVDIKETESGGFWHDMVAPLEKHMDENTPQGDSLQAVCDFLCICVREGRLQDAVVLLRNIRKRTDSWGKVAFGHIAMFVDDTFDEVEGYRLDFKGLGLA